MTSPVRSATSLVRQLGVTSATALVVSNMVGTGAFTAGGYLAGQLGDARYILLVWIIGIIIIVKIVQAFIIQPFIVDGASMLPTYHNQEFLLVDKFSYRIKDPARGDIMIFKLYENKNNPYEGKHLIKRVIGLPGERVTVKDGVTTIYNTKSPKGFVLDESFVEYKDFQKNVDMILDTHHYFVMGDNRAQSYDSRDWGALDAVNIKGQVLFRVYPFKQIGYEPGRYTFTK